jgi:tetratricopeptide (TPR) repeat protein
MPTIFQRLLDEGENALARNQSETAQRMLAAALLIHPENEQAAKSLQRAKVRDEVLQLVSSGERLEKDGKFALAYADFQNAVRLDPLYPSANQGLKRVENQIATDQYTQFMSTGLAALHSNDLKRAREMLLKAKAFQPDAPAVLDALNQLQQAELLARINALLRQAQAAETAQDWNRALKAYQSVLQLDSTVRSAVEGRRRTQDRIHLFKRLEYYLDHPRLLEADEQLQNALALKTQINAMTLTSPRSLDKIKRFEQLLIQAQTRVTVVIQSDDLTEVSVYKVGKLGHFMQRRLDLRPGTYTVVGSRNGYQDVRHKLVVQPGQGTVNITIRCKNPI